MAFKYFNVKNGLVTGEILLHAGNGRIVASSANLGNTVTANFFIGDGGLLTNISSTGGTYIANGNSNVAIDANSNVKISVSGTSNVAVITDTGVNISGYLNATGELTSGNANLGNTVTANYFIGSGNNLSNIQGGNVSGTVANSNFAGYAGTVTSSAQGNITSLGTLTGLAVSGNATVTGNIILGNSGISANGIFGAIGQILTATGNNSAYWSNKFYVGNLPPSTPNYGDIWYYVDDTLMPPMAKLYMWVNDGTSEYFYDFLPPTF